MTRKEITILAFIISVLIVSIVVGHRYKLKQAEIQKHGDIERALNLAIDDENDRTFSNIEAKKSPLLPRTQDNVDATVFAKKDSNLEDVYVVRLTTPALGEDEQDLLPVSENHVLYTYILVDLSQEEPEITCISAELSNKTDTHTDEESISFNNQGRLMLGEDLYAIHHYRVDKNPRMDENVLR